MPYNRALRTRLVGDKDLATTYLREGRVFVGQVLDQAQRGGRTFAAATRTNAAGVTFHVTWGGGLPNLTITTPKAAAVKATSTVWLYITTAGGLRIFDLGTKSLLRTLTGLHDYEVDGVTSQGRYVYLTHVAGVVLRLDTSDLSFIFKTQSDYSTIGIETDGTLVPDCLAQPVRSDPSPDGSRLLVTYIRTLDSGLSIIDGLGGIILANGETLVQIRDIRMGYRPHATAWAPDGEHFFLGTAVGVDGGGTPPFPITADSGADFVSMFTRDGTFVASRQVGTWPGSVGTGFTRSVRSVAVSQDGTRVFAAVAATSGGGDHSVVCLDASDPALPILDMYILPTVFADPPTQVAVRHDGGRVVVRLDDAQIIQLDVSAGGSLSLFSDTTDSNFETTAASELLVGNVSNYRVMQQAAPSPNDTFGGPWFFLTKNGSVTGTVFAYSSFDSTNSYEYDISSYTIRERYALLRVEKN